MNQPLSANGPYVPRPRPSIAGTTELIGRELDDYAVSIERFRQGRVPEAVFLESRLRHGIYGQRQDGVHMMRSKLPLGLLSPEQLEAFADLTETWSAGIAHLTTRQDIQVHFIELERSVDVMKVLARADMTSREACGNVVRNVTAGPLSGVEHGEPFDVTPYGIALAQHLLRLPDGQSLGRKFKITLTGTTDRRFDTTSLHDLGLLASVQDGRRGFRVFIGGGLGAVPHEALVHHDFLPAEELLPFAQAVLRVFAAHGEKKKRARARLKFLVADWGIDRFREAVAAARAEVTDDPRWHAALDTDGTWTDAPIHPPSDQRPSPRNEDDATWLRTNLYEQRQPGYAAVQVRVPRGDLVPEQLRALAGLLRAHAGDTLRIGDDQSLWIRWVPLDRLLEVRDALSAIGLGDAKAGGLGDPVTCPGADTCKLGITTPRALSRQIQGELDELAADPRLERLRLHVSGCPNACARHHIGDIGLFGAARTVDGVTAPHYMLLLGGLAGGAHHEEPGDGFGTTILKLPAFRVGEAVRRLTGAYLEEGLPDEAFGRFARRVGRQRLKSMLDDLTEIPPPSIAPELYVEHGRTAAFKVVRGTGECAGAVVLAGDLLLMEADREADAATEALSIGADADTARGHALRAFHHAGRALLSTQGVFDVADHDLLETFRARIYDAGIVYEGVGHHLLQALSEPASNVVGDRLRRLVVEAGLFVEEAHSVLARLQNPAEVPE
jgi:sulfite reductase (ferredoxin)